MVHVPRMTVLDLADGAYDVARYLLAGAFYAVIVGLAGLLAVKGALALADAGLPALSASVFERSDRAPLPALPAPTRDAEPAGKSAAVSSGRIADSKIARGRSAAY